MQILVREWQKRPWKQRLSFKRSVSNDFLKHSDAKRKHETSFSRHHPGVWLTVKAAWLMSYIYSWVRSTSSFALERRKVKRVIFFKIDRLGKSLWEVGPEKFQPFNICSVFAVWENIAEEQANSSRFRKIWKSGFSCGVWKICSKSKWWRFIK